MNLVSQGMFCKVNTSDYEQYGLEQEDVVYIAGSQFSAIDEHDPYVGRLLFICIPITDSGVGEQMFYLNGLNLEILDEKAQEHYKAILQKEEAKLAGQVH